MEFTTTVSPKGQIVVPRPIRDKLNVKTSDIVKVQLEGDRIIVKPVAKSEDLFGSFKPLSAITKKDIKQAKASHLNKKFS